MDQQSIKSVIKINEKIIEKIKKMGRNNEQLIEKLVEKFDELDKKLSNEEYPDRDMKEKYILSLLYNRFGKMKPWRLNEYFEIKNWWEK